MQTYTNGLTFKTTKDITKNDIINVCNLLNSRVEYSNLCEFQPEPICEGGIVFKFKQDNPDNKWYKTVRLGLGPCIIFPTRQWPWIDNDYLDKWTGSDDIIIDKNNKFETFLKSFDGAPPFTLNELKIWEECFNTIGIVKVGKYPSKKDLTTLI